MLCWEDPEEEGGRKGGGREGGRKGGGREEGGKGGGREGERGREGMGRKIDQDLNTMSWKQCCGMHTLWVHQLDAYDRFDDVGDDIVEQEAAVGNE